MCARSVAALGGAQEKSLANAAGAHNDSIRMPNAVQGNGLADMGR